jgi:hypothetical protein
MIVDVMGVDDGWLSAVNLTGDQFSRRSYQAREIFIGKIPNQKMLFTKQLPLTLS